MSRIIGVNNWASSEGEGPIYASVLLDYFLDDKSNTWAEKIIALIESLDEGGCMATMKDVGDFVVDLWAVFPELEGEESPVEFAEKVRLAADLARREDAHDELRERMRDVFNHGYAHGEIDAREEGEGDD